MRKEKGITLIALIITIIVMLILVAVSVSILINSGLIGKAKSGAKEYKNQSEQEANLDSFTYVDENGTNHTTSIDDFTNLND